MNATSPASPNALPDEWIVRIHAHMIALYGTKFSQLWQGTDPAHVRSVWAQKLAGFRDMPDAIAAALKALDDRPFPPTLPEFLALCREAAKRQGTSRLALPAPRIDDAIARQRLAELKARFNFKKPEEHACELDHSN